MRKLLLAALACLLCHGAFADMLGPSPAFMKLATSPSVAAAGYTGLFESSGNQAATGYWGVRCYSASQASLAQAVKVRRASDNTTQDVGLTAGCDFNITSANSFAGTDATCTGSMTGTTTLTITACASGTLHVSDTITGAGIVQPAYIATIGSCASPPGTCTMNKAQTFSSETVTAQVAMYADTVYHQTGSVSDCTQATQAQQAQLLPSDANGKPFLVFPVINGYSCGSITLSQPMTWETVMSRTNAVTTSQVILISDGPNTQLQFTSSANTTQQYAGTAVVKTATDCAVHVFQSMFNGASSVWNIDDVGTPIGASNAGTQGMGGTFEVGATAGLAKLAGVVYEWAVEPIAFSTAIQTAVYNNAHAYFGTPNPC